jgi:DnaK suppressor protein
MTRTQLEEIREHLQSQLVSLDAYNFAMDAPLCADINEYASLVSDAQIKVAMHARTSLQIRDIQSALEKMEYAGYGFCEECGEFIGIPRLKARPTATLCVECQASREERKRAARER